MKNDDEKLLHKQFPGVYAAAEALPHWTLVPDDLLTFLSPRCSGKALAVILALRNCADHEATQFVKRTDDTLAAMLGMDDANLRRIKKSAEFQRFVTVESGEPRSKGKSGKANTYLLTPLFDSYREWRRLRAFDTTVLKGMSRIEETRARALEVFRAVCSQPIAAMVWRDKLTDEAIKDALSRSVDIVDAVRLLFEEGQPLDVVESLYTHMGSTVPDELRERFRARNHERRMAKLKPEAQPLQVAA